MGFHVNFTGYCIFIPCSWPIRFFIVSVMFHNNIYCVGTLNVIILKMEFSKGHSSRWVFLSTVSRSNWNLECWYLWREENGRTLRKDLWTRSNDKLNPHVMPGPGIETRLQWWGASAITTEPSLFSETLTLYSDTYSTLQAIYRNLVVFTASNTHAIYSKSPASKPHVVRNRFFPLPPIYTLSGIKIVLIC